MYWLVLGISLVVASFACCDSLPIEPDPTMTYMSKRKEWLLEDAKVNFSNGIILSDAEKRLESYLQTFCYHFWNHFLESNLFPPSRNFSEAKIAIENTLLFRILRRMPKGGILHIHTDSTGNANWLIKRALAEDNCYVYMQEDDGILKGTMRIFAKGEAPQGFVQMRQLAASDVNFVSKLVAMITMDAHDTASINPWEKFNACFARIEHLFYYEPIFRDYYKHAFEAIAEDHIQFVELRASIDDLYDSSGKVYSNNDVINLYRSIVNDVRKKYPFFTLKLIISDFRSNNLTEANSSLERAFQFKRDNPDIVAGYDLVGFETQGHSLLYYLDNLLTSAAHFEAKYNVELPYFFHAGESGWGHDKNPYDAVLLKSKRIGHGFNLVHFPGLLQEIKRQNICIEVCPISNQVLGYAKDLRMHPAVGYLRQGVPCVLSPDDPMLYKTSGLSYDFWDAIMAWNLTLADIKQLCINSIHYSSLDEEEKEAMLACWEAEWETFVRQMLADLQITN